MHDSFFVSVWFRYLLLYPFHESLSNIFTKHLCYLKFRLYVAIVNVFASLGIPARTLVQFVISHHLAKQETASDS